MLSLYIHIPFCVRKCPYCGFYSTLYDNFTADAYIPALSREASSYDYGFNYQVFETVYIGGGTPSILSEDQFSLLMNDVFRKFRIHPDAEVTLESNPNSVTEQKLETWLKRGVNRLSIGVQSFSDPVLQTLGRLHDSRQASEALILARRAGFKNIGMDLIYGIPNQTHSAWEETVRTALAHKPHHLSLYSLSFDDGSLFRKEADAGRMRMPDDDSVASMYESAVSMLTGAGYIRYEISNFAQPGMECRHNMNYWNRGEYLGLGAGAWSFIKGRRSRTIADIAEYVRRMSEGISADAETEIPDRAQSARETIMLSLRTAQGLDLQRFRDRYGTPSATRLERNGSRCSAEGLAHLHGNKLVLTERGILLSNEALTRLSE